MSISDIFPRRVWVVPILERFLREAFSRGVSWPCARWHHLPRAGLGSTVATFLLLLLPPVPTVGVTPKLPKMSKVPSLVATQYCTRHQGSPTLALVMKRSPYRRLWIHPSISSVSRHTALLSRLTISFSCSTLWDPDAYGIRYLHFFCFLPRPQLCPDLSSMCLIKRLLFLLTFHSLLLIFYLYIYTTPRGGGGRGNPRAGRQVFEQQAMKYERSRPKYTVQAGDQECSRGMIPFYTLGPHFYLLDKSFFPQGSFSDMLEWNYYIFLTRIWAVTVLLVVVVVASGWVSWTFWRECSRRPGLESLTPM